MSLRDGYEYRVCWRREYDGRFRTRLYQTRGGATNFAHFLEHMMPKPNDESVLGKTLARLGEPIEAWVERREVGDWRPI